jgi:hypothetical protein
MLAEAMVRRGTACPVFNEDRHRRPSTTQAAFFELLAAAARTRIISTDPSERIPVGFTLGKFGLGLLEMPLLRSAVVIAEAVPVRQFLNRVAKQREFGALWMSWFIGSLDGPFEIPLEIPETESQPVNEATVEGPFDEDLEFAQAEHRK